jgi:hypothetical protein
MTETDRARQEPPSMADAAEMLWVVLASVSGGDWTKQSVEWQEAAARWRDYYFAALTASSVPPVREAATPAELQKLATEQEIIAPAPRADVDAVPREEFIAEVKDKFGVVFNGCQGTPLQRATSRAQCEQFLIELFDRALAAAVQARQLAEDFAAQAEMHANDLLQQLNAAVQAQADAQQAWCAFTKTQTDQHAKELAAAHQARADTEREWDAKQDELIAMAMTYKRRAEHAEQERDIVTAQRDELAETEQQRAELDQRLAGYSEMRNVCISQPFGPWFRAALARIA